MLSQGFEDDHVPPAQGLDAAGLEKDPVPGAKEGAHALAAAEDGVFVFSIHSGHSEFHSL